MDTSQSRLLFVKILNNSFVSQDQAILEEVFELRPFAFGVQRGAAQIVRQIQLLIWLLRYIWGAQQIFIWFADYHAFLPSLLGRILGKKVTIIIGGFDAIKRPDLGYGGHSSLIRSRVIKWSCGLAHQLLPVSQWTLRNLEANTSASLAAKSKLLYNGVDDKLFLHQTSDHLNRTGVICVAAVKDKRTLIVKGLDRVKMLAYTFPDIPFCIAGVSKEALSILQEDAPSNLLLIEWVERQDLADLYQQYKVVCQLSRSESFGLALAEGMLCGCIGLSIEDLGCAEIIAPGTGFLAPDGEEDTLISTLQKALNASSEMHKAPPVHIQSHFMLSQRASRLRELMNAV